MEAIFVVEDDLEVANVLNIVLDREGYKVKVFHTGNDFLEQVYDHKPDLIILDILLPDISGLELCKELKKTETFKKIPTVALSSRSEKCDIMTGLDIGFDDYLTKPFDNNILLSKINAVLRKERYIKGENHSIINLNNDLILDVNSYSLTISGESIKLSSLELKTLALLIENKNKVIKRNTIIDVIRGNDCDSTDRSADKLINRIRKKIGSYSENIVSVYGVGYCFKENNKENEFC